MWLMLYESDSFFTDSVVFLFQSYFILFWPIELGAEVFKKKLLSHNYLKYNVRPAQSTSTSSHVHQYYTVC